ncbi:MAG: hypothetical protein Q8S31_05280 [Alphaproteobacteria bacterium]|nr:hypothetical protein [Alphaproteobacteria bacterium]
MKKLFIFIVLLTFANSSHAVSRFDPILKEIIKYQEFENETNNKIKNNEQLYANVINKNYYDHRFVQECRDEFITELYNNIIKLQNSKTTGSDFFKYLLKKRLEGYIYNPSKRLEDGIATNIPFNDFLFNSWIKLHKAQQYYDYNKFASKNDNKRYELIVNLIKKTFQLLSIEELDKRTIKLIRASPSVWNILQNKTFNLGNYDEAGGYIKVQTYMQHFGIGINEAIKKIQNKESCPSWNKIKNKTDLYLYESHFILKKRFIESKSLGANGSGMTYTITDYEAGECNDLPYPDFLKIQPEQPFVELPNFFDTFDFNLFSDEIETSEKTIPQPDEKSMESENNNNNTNNIQQTDKLEEKSKNIIDNSEPDINNNIIDNNTKNEIADDEDYLAPSGIRKFHNLMPEAPYPPLNLKKKHQKFVDRIFNSKTSHTISYGEFKKFWSKMGGKIVEDTGSSHKQLIGPKGDALYGVSAHNDAHTYGKQTIKYFRAALYYIGCRPS